MRTFTLDGHTLTAGIAAADLHNGFRLTILPGDTGLRIDGNNPPPLEDERIVRASLGAPYRRSLGGVRALSPEFIEREKDKIFLDPCKVSDLVAERSDDTAGALVLVHSQRECDLDLAEYPDTVRVVYPPTKLESYVKSTNWCLIQLAPGTSVMFVDGFSLELAEDADEPQLFAWQQRALRAFSPSDGEGDAVACYNLDFEAPPQPDTTGMELLESMLAECDTRSFASYAPKLALGIPLHPQQDMFEQAVVFGSTEHPAYLPMIGRASDQVVTAGRLVQLAEHRVYSPHHWRNDRPSIKFFGLMPEVALPEVVAVDTVAYARELFKCSPPAAIVQMSEPGYRFEIFRGSPEVLNGEPDPRYIDKNQVSCMLVIRAGDVVKISSAKARYGGDQLLWWRNGAPAVTSYNEWRVADMAANPKFYERRHRPSVLRTNMGTGWVGELVTATLGDGRKVTGELLQVCAYDLRIKRWWTNGQRPHIVDCEPLWVTLEGHGIFPRLPRERQVEFFRSQRFVPATYADGLRTALDLWEADAAQLEQLVRPVVEVKLSAHPEIPGFRVYQYGAPAFTVSGEDNDRQFRLTPTWYNTQEEAAASRADFMRKFLALRDEFVPATNSGDEEVKTVAVRLIKAITAVDGFRNPESTLLLK